MDETKRRGIILTLFKAVDMHQQGEKGARRDQDLLDHLSKLH